MYLVTHFPFSIFILCSLYIIYIDIKKNIIPDWITLPLIILGVGFSIFSGSPNWVSSIVGAVFGYAVCWVFLIMYRFIKRSVSHLFASSKDKWQSEIATTADDIGLGGGDAKYLSAIGAFLGFQGVFIVLFMSSVIALIVFIIRMLCFKTIQKYLPFGPFLAISSILIILLNRYL